MQYALKHSLTKAALTNLLDVMRAFLPRANKLPTSFYLVKKFFEKRCPEVTKIKNVSFCGMCHCEVADSECPNGCSKPVQEFLYIPIAPQLKRMATGFLIAYFIYLP